MCVWSPPWAWFWEAVGANEEAMWWLRRALETPGLDDVPRARLLEGMAMHSLRRVTWTLAGGWPRRRPSCGRGPGLPGAASRR